MGLHTITILPRQLEYFIDRKTDNKTLRLVNKLLILAAVLLFIWILRPAYASVCSFFGYEESTIDTFTNILSGTYIKNTLNKYFADNVFNAVLNQPIIADLSNAMSGVGILIVFINMMMKVIDIAQNGGLTEEKLAACLIQFALPILLILNITLVTDAASKIGMFIKDKGMEAIEKNEDKFEEYDFEDINSLDDIKNNLEIAADTTKYNINLLYNKTLIYFHVRDLVENGRKTSTSDSGDAEHVEYSYIDEQSDINQWLSEQWHDAADNTEDSVWETSGKGIAAMVGWCGLSAKNGFSAIKNGIFKSVFGTEEGEDFVNTLIENAALLIITLCLMFMDMGLRVSIVISCFGVYGRLVIYQAFLPLGISDIGLEGTRSNGMRLIKMFIGVYLEILMFFVINKVFWDIFGILVMMTTTLAECIVCFLGAGAGFKASIKSARPLSEKILGTR